MEYPRKTWWDGVMEDTKGSDMSQEDVQVWNKWKKKSQCNWITQVIWKTVVKTVCMCMYVCHAIDKDQWTASQIPVTILFLISDTR